MALTTREHALNLILNELDKYSSPWGEEPSHLYTPSTIEHPTTQCGTWAPHNIQDPIIAPPIRADILAVDTLQRFIWPFQSALYR